MKSNTAFQPPQELTPEIKTPKKRKGRQAARAHGPEINVTPLIDVLLTLIIVFMVVVSMEARKTLRWLRLLGHQIAF